MESINIFIITDFLSILLLGIFYLYYLNKIFMEYEK